MPINVNSLYNNVLGQIDKDQNGYFSFGYFNQELPTAERTLLRYLTGDIVETNDMPMPFKFQKNKDYLAPFITKFETVGDFSLPADYYNYQYLYKLGKIIGSDCEGEISDIDGCDTPMPILDEDAFNGRCNSSIEGLTPTGDYPIACLSEGGIKIKPKNSGSVRLIYIRYPNYGFLASTLDTTYNVPVYDAANSRNLEWGEWATEYLTNYLVSRFATYVRERSLKENSIADKPRG